MISFKQILISFVFIFFVTEMGANFTNHNSCGLTSNSATNQIQSQQFIVGGKGIGIETFPFMVSLQHNMYGEWSHFCGGSILNSRWILTAAHCIKMPAFDSPANIRILIGQTNNKYKGRDPTTEYKVEKWIINGCFMKNVEDVLSDDITLLKTTKDIVFNRPNVKPICLPPKNAEPISHNITIAGWGIWSEQSIWESMLNPDLPDDLQMAESTLVSEEFCQIYTYFRNIGLNQWPLGSRICVRQKESTGCRGDSGGPAFQEVNGRWYQFGIASFISGRIIPPPIVTCYKANPIMYLKTNLYIDWISQSIQKYSDTNDNKIETEC